MTRRMPEPQLILIWMYVVLLKRININLNKWSVICYSSPGVRASLKQKINIKIDNSKQSVSSTVIDMSHDRKVTLIWLLYSNYYIVNFKLWKQLCESLVLSFTNYCMILHYLWIDNITKYKLHKIKTAAEELGMIPTFSKRALIPNLKKNPF